ncbi:MAG: GGDEF domain-containing protein [Treponema sp.]|nr:GGDEF domain-containing protein [Treponema sp.]
MLYAIAPATFLIVNIILNWELFKKYGFTIKKADKQNEAHIHYNWFLITANCYLLVDMTWGILYTHRDNQVLFPFIYYLTVLYFLFMLLSMLEWTRYIISYIDNKGRSSIFISYGAWIIVAIGIVCLILNRFFHFMFSYNEANEYIGETGRNISFILQISFHTIVSIYMLYVAHKSPRHKKIRYKAVANTGIILGIFLTFQIFFALFPFYAMGLLIGICLIHSIVEAGEKKEKEVHDHIASAMAEDYEAIFYIDLKSDEYMTFSKSQKYMTLNAVETGKDFFTDALQSLKECTYPDDLEYAKSFYNKETMLKNLEGKRSFSFKYRVLINNKPRFFLFTMMRESNSQYLIFYEKDIEDELNAERAQKENQKQNLTFGQIAESLASNYDVIYYVNITDSSYVCYQVNNIYGQLEVNRSGDDFFTESLNTIPQITHEQDCEGLSEFINKDSLISKMENHKDCSITYRLIVSGKSHYTRMTVRKSSDGSHFIICVETIDDEIKRERQHLRELKTEKELARRDELTGVKNKTAYKEFEASIQANIDSGLEIPNFALVVCDSNNLKQINDTKGHAAGDEYIRASAHILCNIFVHSPVFRVGGDEFVVYLRGNDYSTRLELMEKLQKQILENKKKDSGVILASGMSVYNPESDKLVSDIFKRADQAMYENKKQLKSVD